MVGDNLVSHHVRMLPAGLADYRREGKTALCFLIERGRVLLDTVALEEVSA